MKKKLLIFLAVIGVVTIVGYSSMASETPKETINQRWEFKGEPVKKIAIDGAQQDVNVEIVESPSGETTVELVGTVSTSAAKLLAKAKVEDGQLTLPLSKNGIRFMVSSKEKEPITLKISTNLEQPFEELNLDLLTGEVKVVVPTDYQGRYETDIYQGTGKVISVPETTEKMNSIIRVSTSEDITINQ